MTHATWEPPRLASGNYGRVYWCIRDRKEKRELTDEGRELLASILQKHPAPIALLKKVYPNLLAVCRGMRLTDDEINSVCMEGMILAVCRYRTGGAHISTVLAWGVRGSVTDLIRRTQGPVNHESSASDHWLRAEDEMSQEPAAKEVDLDTMHDLEALMVRAKLSVRDLMVLRGRFAGHNLRDLAKEFGISKERVRQIETAAIARIRQRNGVKTPHEISHAKRIDGIKKQLVSLLSSCGALGMTEIQGRLNRKDPRWIYEALNELRVAGKVRRRHLPGGNYLVYEVTQ
jgi:RNA polymerase sigma factor (sigma-70 family)